MPFGLAFATAHLTIFGHFMNASSNSLLLRAAPFGNCQRRRRDTIALLEDNGVAGGSTESLRKVVPGPDEVTNTERSMRGANGA